MTELSNERIEAINENALKLSERFIEIRAAFDDQVNRGAFPLASPANHYIGALQVLSEKRRTDISDLLADNKRLRERIAELGGGEVKLPKTADGVPIHSKMKVWFEYLDAPGEISSKQIPDLRRCYSTEQAARDAAEGGGA